MYINHKDLVKDALGLDSDWIMRSSLLLEECGPEIMHIVDVTNTVVNTFSKLECHYLLENEDMQDDVALSLIEN